MINRSECGCSRPRFEIITKSNFPLFILYFILDPTKFDRFHKNTKKLFYMNNKVPKNTSLSRHGYPEARIILDIRKEFHENILSILLNFQDTVFESLKLPLLGYSQVLTSLTDGCSGILIIKYHIIVPLIRVLNLQ